MAEQQDSAVVGAGAPSYADADANADSDADITCIQRPITDELRAVERLYATMHPPPDANALLDAILAENPAANGVSVVSPSDGGDDGSFGLQSLNYRKGTIAALCAIVSNHRPTALSTMWVAEHTPLYNNIVFIVRYHPNGTATTATTAFERAIMGHAIVDETCAPKTGGPEQYAELKRAAFRGLKRWYREKCASRKKAAERQRARATQKATMDNVGARLLRVRSPVPQQPARERVRVRGRSRSVPRSRSRSRSRSRERDA
jgi:hypothetical protein